MNRHCAIFVILQTNIYKNNLNQLEQSHNFRKKPNYYVFPKIMFSESHYFRKKPKFMFLTLGLSSPKIKNLREFLSFCFLGCSLFYLFFGKEMYRVLFKYGFESTNYDVRQLFNLKYSLKAKRSVHYFSKFVASNTRVWGTVDGVLGSPWLGIITKTTYNYVTLSRNINYCVCSR